MTRQNRQTLPIGYWLKRADQLLTARIDDAQRANNLTRLDWQAPNTMRESGSAARDEIVQMLRPFADARAVDDVLSRLAERGVVTRSVDGKFALTQEGTELHERAQSSRKAIRQRAIAGISDAEYSTAVAVLQRLVENLKTVHFSTFATA
jgi:hypothetical protein